ncbi:MAG: hypothetical protein JWP94_46 [Mucilaginibacter sp.]|nr:hypothetical protein [Mucilaginibacter sp.]
MLLKKILFVCLFVTYPFTCRLENCSVGSSLPVIVPRGFHGGRFFGDLTTEYTIDSTGRSALCTLYVASVFANVQLLNASSPTYNFNLKLGLGSANGTITLSLVDSPFVSTLKSNFNYSVSANNTSFSYIGDLVGWYSKGKSN